MNREEELSAEVSRLTVELAITKLDLDQMRKAKELHFAQAMKNGALANEIAAQRDEAISRAEVAEEAKRAVEADLARAKRTAKVTDANWRQLAAELARIRSDRQKEQQP